MNAPKVGKVAKESEMGDPKVGKRMKKVETGGMKVGRIGEEDSDKRTESLKSQDLVKRST